MASRVRAVLVQTLRRAGAIGAHRVESIADAAEDAADSIEHSAERAARRFDESSRAG
jgi:hypothetical protein